jgi:hypothetical protein
MQDFRQRLLDVWGGDDSDSSQALSWIRSAVQRGAEETLYLDFKQKSGAKSGVPGDDDRANLAKAISGFSNTDGGLVIWGVKAKPASKDDADVATDLVPISSLRTFVSRLNALAGEVVSPPVAGVENRLVPIPDDTDRGFAVSVVPKKRDALVQASARTCRGFFIRTGSGFHQLPSSLIAEFYSRRPSPLLGVGLEPLAPSVREVLESAEHRKPEHPHDKPGRPWGRCLFSQHLVLPWRAVLRNDGLATAIDVRFRLAVELPTSAQNSWSVLDVARSGSRFLSPGLAPVPYSLAPEFITITALEGGGRILDDVHPGQDVVIAQGEAVVPAEGCTGRERGLCISGVVYARDAAPSPFRTQVSEEAVRNLLRPLVDGLAPTVRMLPEPASWEDG